MSQSRHQEAVQEAHRLASAGLVYHERQRDGHCWIAPPEQHQDGQMIVRILPLPHATPKPGMEIRAHGEIYLLPLDFEGTWFDVFSTKGVPLIP